MAPNLHLASLRQPPEQQPPPVGAFLIGLAGHRASFSFEAQSKRRTGVWGSLPAACWKGASSYTSLFVAEFHPKGEPRIFGYFRRGHGLLNGADMPFEV